MIFFLNANGNTTIVKNEAINQGSIDANSLIIVAPFSRTNVVSASFILPNGLVVEGGIAVPLADLGTTPLKDNNGNIYNSWGLDLDFPATQYSGTVKVQFSISLGSGKTLKTYTTQFEVSKGIVANLPSFDEIANGEEIYTKIKDYLASISENMMSALENGISYIRYYATDNLLNGADSGCSLYVVNGNNTIEVNAETREQIEDITNGDVTVASMTEYLTKAQIENPNLDNGDINSGIPANKDLYFYQSNTNTRPTGFIVKLPQMSSISMVQLYIYGVRTNCNLQVSIGNGGSYGQPTTINLKPLVNYEDSINEMQIIRVPLNIANAQYIKVVQTTGNANQNYICKGIEIFSLTTKGYYEIVQNNGNVSVIDSYNADTLIAEVEGLKDQAQASEESAQKWAEGTDVTTDPQYHNSAKYYAQRVFNLAGQTGGYPILEDIGGVPKIPSVYINLANGITFVDIDSEDELNTTYANAEPGTVARLVVDADNELGVVEVTKSFVKLNGSGWALYGASYADNATNSLYAGSATNSTYVNGVSVRKMSQSAFDDLTSEEKNGVIFVVLGE